VRDGRPYAVRNLADLELLPGVADALTRLHDAGFVLVVVTNQRDVGDGVLAREVLDAMHAELMAALPIDAIEVCTCGDGCRRYKPAPGMLEDAAARLGIDLERSFLVGDRWRDVGAGRAAGCTTIFVDHGYDEALRDEPDHVVASISDAAAVVLTGHDLAP
jgi:D-glycero-D-manno-heptose 1,7-bisphosphate phosphatase